MNPSLKKQIHLQLEKALGHLEYSYQKVQKMDLGKDLDEEALETLESFASRFARYSDLIVAKYFRLLAKEKDPAFNGSVIDLLNLAEKYNWIQSTENWKRIREIRNLAAHEYTLEDYTELYKEIFQLTPSLMEIDITQ